MNASQLRYRAKSRINPTGGVIPEAMAAPTARALDDLERRVGDIDTWVATRLGWTVLELGDRLSSEQVDAVALGIDAIDRGEGLIVADMTGFGKGRILASLALANFRDGRNLVFLTEKENLFSDFWRDIRDIAADDLFVRPFMLNKDSRIIDMSDTEGSVLHEAWKPSLVKEAIRSRELPSGTRVILATYSQFNRAGSSKAEFLAEMVKGALLIPDEAHNFVGEDSATSRNIGEALLGARASVFSSATFARDIHNLGAYKSVFPWLRRMGDPSAWTPAQRRAVAEESIRLAAQAGRAIRREHDLSTVRLRVVEDIKRKPRNEDLHAKLAPILSDMARLSALVFRKTMDLNDANKAALQHLRASERKEMKRTWTGANFGTRLNGIIGQFLIAIELDLCIDQCVEALLAGKKPVIVIESTMESLMRELSRSPEDVTQKTPMIDLEEDELPAEKIDESVDVETKARPPTFREALLVMADRLLQLNCRHGNGMRELVHLDDPAMLRMQERIKAQASAFPELPLSPIDDLRDRLEEIGRKLHKERKIPHPWVVDEISARTMRVQNGRYVPTQSPDRNVIVARFNANAIHALILTSAGSTGLSIHDGPKAPHHAPRVMIEFRAPRDTLRRVQTFGRVLRRGQLSEPEFVALSSGLDAQVYEMAASNRKMIELSASVTGEGKSSMAFDVPDPIDAVGDMVARDLLLDNQHLAEAMAISLERNQEEVGNELYYVNKLMRRLWLLPPRSCRAMFSALIQGRAERLAGGAGIHHDGHALSGLWKIGREDILELGDGSSDPLDGPDIVLTTIRQTQEVKPLSWDDAVHLAEQGMGGIDQSLLNGLRKEIETSLPASLEAVLPRRRFKTVAQALGHEGENSVKRLKTKADTIKLLLANALPGVPALLPGEDGEMRQALVVGMSLPSFGMALRGRGYELQYLVAGEVLPRKVSFDAIHRILHLVRFSNRNLVDRLKPFFNAAPRGQVSVERKVLTGNALGAVLASRRLGGGTRASFELEGKGRQYGILVPRNLERRLLDLPIRLSTAQEVLMVLGAGGDTSSQLPSAEDAVNFRTTRLGGVELVFPQSRKDSYRYTELLRDSAPDLEFPHQTKFRVPKEIVTEFLCRLSREGALHQCAARYREIITSARTANRLQREGGRLPPELGLGAARLPEAVSCAIIHQR